MGGGDLERVEPVPVAGVAGGGGLVAQEAGVDEGDAVVEVEGDVADADGAALVEIVAGVADAEAGISGGPGADRQAVTTA